MSQTATGENQCECVHHNALTCIAERNHTTRFNASIIFATSTSQERNGKCQCLCHRDAVGLPVSEQAWAARRATNPLAERPKNREAYRNLKQYAARRDGVAR